MCSARIVVLGTDPGVVPGRGPSKVKMDLKATKQSLLNLKKPNSKLPKFRLLLLKICPQC